MSLLIQHVRMIIACATFVTAFIGASGFAHAQNDDCLCDHYTFRLNAAVPCSVTVSWTFSYEGPVFTETIAPGGTLVIPCPVFAAYIHTCTGSCVILGGDPGVRPCVGSIRVGPGCCVLARHTIDRQGCAVIQLDPDPACPDADC